jgi:hypothetical protein
MQRFANVGVGEDKLFLDYDYFSSPKSRGECRDATGVEGVNNVIAPP